ncbi:MAG: hypothetical protein SGJ11_10445 [Phycisphaerae bacterium]|nr:hypothetical protein [Phycisphaerae bacterium]
MQCNIDSRGKAARLVAGAAVEVAGLVLVTCWLLESLPLWGGILGGISVIAGLFLMFEGAVGWCALRALGVKTPL